MWEDGQWCPSKCMYISGDSYISQDSKIPVTDIPIVYPLYNTTFSQQIIGN